MKTGWVSCLLTVCSALSPMAEARPALDAWTYVQVDNSRQQWGNWNEPSWLKYFGLAMADVTGDGYRDIVAGRYFYRNPGGDMSGKWPRIDLGFNVDGMLFVDVDGDAYGDVIATALPDVYWLEAEDEQATRWKRTSIGTLKKTGHVNGQGYMLAQIVPGGRPEILLACEDGVYAFEIPAEPGQGNWPKTRIAHETMDEGIGVGDLDADGDIDIVCGRNEDEKYSVVCFLNPGDGSSDWPARLVGPSEHAPDRIVLADMNADERLDVVVSEERYPGKEPDANLSWYEQLPGDAFLCHVVITEYSLNNLDLADMDGDGDMDIVTCEHKGPKGRQKLQIFENDGRGRFTEHIIDRGKESHLGARVADMDGDGDYDIVSAAWDYPEFLHLWRNDAVAAGARAIPRVRWRHVSTRTGQIDFPDVGRQAASLILDIDKDGTDDIVIAGWSKQTSMVWLKKQGARWKRHLIDQRQSHIEAGGTYADIDGDGDLDILQGGSWATNAVWWWENPHPDFDPAKPWERYTIKDSGAKQHHDQIFGDFDGNGRLELAFWNQQAQRLWIADIPDEPQKKENWRLKEIWSWPRTFKYEGLAQADIDGDRTVDLIGGGMWFQRRGDGTFASHAVDSEYGSSRSAAGDLIEGGRVEIVLGSGDTVGPLNLYQYRDGRWSKTTLIEVVDHGHTLQLADVDGDGHLDIFTAEMAHWHNGANPDARMWFLYGNGRGQFDITELTATQGLGNHESKLGDLDGDGDLDILQKPFELDEPKVNIDIWLNEGAAR
ncbi:MAG: VCBS repeat-containing protein [Phycisphaerales bacterium]|nr:MAG: VCBS repeat-containing protein [Phycisphaerales bacterium]